MPLVRLETNVELNKEQTTQLMKKLSTIISSETGKSEKYVMVTAAPTHMIMGGAVNLAAFVGVYSIGGLTKTVNEDISRNICALLENDCDIQPEHVYISFNDVAGENWGWNNATFG